jgi:hypothetical protein
MWECDRCRCPIRGGQLNTAHVFTGANQNNPKKHALVHVRAASKGREHVNWNDVDTRNEEHRKREKKKKDERQAKHDQSRREPAEVKEIQYDSDEWEQPKTKPSAKSSRL